MAKKKRIMLYPNSHALRNLGSSSAGIINLAVEHSALTIAQTEHRFAEYYREDWERVATALADCPLPPIEGVAATVGARLRRVGIEEEELSLEEALYLLLSAYLYHEYKEEIPEDAEWWTLEFRHKFLAEKGIL